MLEVENEQIELLRRHLVDRQKVTKDGVASGSELVSLRLVRHLKMQAKKRDFTWIIDEPKERGGTGEGPNPLAFFVSGAASCLMVHLATEFIVSGISVESLEMKARARYTLWNKPSFKEIVYDIEISGRETEPRVLMAFQRAESLCIASNTLKNSGIALTSNIFLNGKKIA